MLVKTSKIRQKPTHVEAHIVCYIAKADLDEVSKGGDAAPRCSQKFTGERIQNTVDATAISDSLDTLLHSKYSLYNWSMNRSEDQRTFTKLASRELKMCSSGIPYCSEISLRLSSVPTVA